MKKCSVCNHAKFDVKELRGDTSNNAFGYQTEEVKPFYYDYED